MWRLSVSSFLPPIHSSRPAKLCLSLTHTHTKGEWYTRKVDSTSGIALHKAVKLMLNAWKCIIMRMQAENFWFLHPVWYVVYYVRTLSLRCLTCKARIQGKSRLPETFFPALCALVQNGNPCPGLRSSSHDADSFVYLCITAWPDQTLANMVKAACMHK